MARKTTGSAGETRRSTARAQVRGGKRSGTPRKHGAGQLPDTVTGAMDWAFRAGIRAAHEAARKRDDVLAARQRIADAAAAVLGKLQDAAYQAQASTLAEWLHVRDLDEPPDDSIAIALWMVARLCRVIQGALAGDFDDPEAARWVLREVRSMGARAASQPLEARVRAWREIREGRAVASQASGPRPQPRGPRRPSLRC